MDPFDGLNLVTCLYQLVLLVAHGMSSAHLLFDILPLLLYVVGWHVSVSGLPFGMSCSCLI